MNHFSMGGGYLRPERRSAPPLPSPALLCSALLQPLPDVFLGVRLRLPAGLAASEAYTLKRYFVGYPLLTSSIQHALTYP